MNSNREYMQRAIRLASRGRYTTDPNPCVGCVIVKADKVVGEGWHRIAGEAHAEINALAQAGSEAQGATVYLSLEPCSHTGKTPPCADALIEAGVKKVFVAMLDPNPLVAGEGIRRLQDAGIEVEQGLLETQARELNPGFIKRMEHGRPFVRVKLAMSIDGRTAMSSGESQWISCEASRKDVQRLRAESSAVMTGVATVIADDPSMNVRLSAQQLAVDTVRQPKRIVVDSQFRMPVDAKISAVGGPCAVYTTVAVDDTEQYPFDIRTIASIDNQVDLKALMQDLAADEINLLHVEAGSILCGALLKDGLVDEIILYMAPHIMGDEAKPLFTIPGLVQMRERIALTIKDVRSVGDDLRLTLSPVSQEQ